MAIPQRGHLLHQDHSVNAKVERIARQVSLDVGGIEYLVDDRDGRHYFYDINALSNFVADARRVIGFDPFERLVDYLVRRSSPKRAVVSGGTLEGLAMAAMGETSAVTITGQ